MLEIYQLRENADFVKERLQFRNFSDINLVNTILQLDETRRKVQFDLDNTLSESNKLSKEIGDLFKSGKRDEAEALRQQTTDLKEQSQQLKEKQNTLETEIHDLLVQLPNLPHQQVAKGTSPNDNVEVRRSGEIPQLPENALEHWDILVQKNLVSLELGNKITGAGFPVFIGKGARLQRALVAFFLAQATENGYEEVIPPFMVNAATAYGTGQLPDKEGQMYHATFDDFYLIPTAEVPVTNIYRDHIFNENDLPVKMTAHSPCFRREAGSYGKDVRGLNRVHQFEKVEIVHFELPEKSYETLEKMVDYVASLLDKLVLPYRVLRLCSGDMGFTSAMTYDFEVFSAAQKKWLEVSSVSNFETFQSNRMKIRYRDEESGKTRLVHTLNGSALALPRIYAAILENYQQADGSIVVPKVLQPYTGFEVI
ncbi:MAG: serine--tRNA ligase [Bacteroidetes bacterium]|nr:serine--tRNA ligase [Bacteroidota bacterium]MCB9043966.1 serine--tRNA ligase [Chitinophagales bacterium]